MISAYADYDCSRLKVIFFDFDGVFTDNKVIVNENGTESVVCDRSDGIGLSRIISGGLKVYIVSTETNPVVSARAKKLKIQAYQSVSDKLYTIKKILAQDGISKEDAMFVGNDINDIEVMKFVGLSAAPADAYPEVKSIANIILKKNGGCGAVREVCDFISDIKSIKPKYNA